MKLFTLLGLCSALVLPAAASAQNAFPALPSGQSLVTLSVTERANVPQDLLQAQLRIESRDKDAKKLQSRINEAMSKALAQAKSYDKVKTSTGYYSVYQYDASKDSRENLQWQGSQTIQLEGKDAEQLLALAGKIQEQGFVMGNLQYTLSTELSDKTRESMMENAIKRGQEKALRAAKALGKDSAEIVQVGIDSNFNDSAPRYMMMSRGAAKEADMAAPVAQAGESEVTLTVNIQAIAK